MGNFANWLGGGTWGPASAAGNGVQKFAAIAVQTSAWGTGIPIVYGTNRVSGNLIYTNDFLAIPNPQKQGVGKGGTVTINSYNYRATAILAICEGPIVGINVVWADLDRKTLAFYGWTLKTGTLGQSPWAYLVSQHPADALAYSGTAYVAAAPLALGSTNSLKNFSFEVQGQKIVGGGNQDALPSDIITDFLTNLRYGAGFDPSRLGNMAVGQDGLAASSFIRYVQQSGFFLSMTIDQQRSASDVLKEILQATNSDAVFTEGLLKIFPYGDEVVGTYTPATTPIYDLTVDDFLVTGPDEDPVSVTRSSLADTYNTIPIEFTDRSNDYNRSTVQDPEPNDSDKYGQRTASAVSLPCIQDQAHALSISRIEAQRSCYVRNTYTFRLGWRYILLDPMDLVTLTEPMLGLNKTVVRIKTIEEDDTGELTMTAEEWPFGVATPTLYTTQSGDGGTPNTAVDPGDVAVPYIFDVPFLFNGDGNARLGVAVAGTTPFWGGCEVWVSADNVTYSLAGTMTGPSRYGKTTTTLAAGNGFDTTHTVGVDLGISGGDLVSTSDQIAQALTALSILDGEFLSFAVATLTGTNQYTLSRLQRGAFGTSGISHATNKLFARLDESLFYYDIPDQFLGSTLYFKFVSVNLFGAAKQDISLLSPYTYTPSTTIGLEPPFPASCTLAITSTQPGLPSPSDFNPGRWLLSEQEQPARLVANVPGMRGKRYATVTWAPVSINPPSLLTRYQVVLYTGTDPNDQSAYVTLPMTVQPGVTSAIFPLSTYDSALTLTAAVAAWYGTDPSAWRTSSGTVVLNPATTPFVSIPQGTTYIDASGNWTATVNVPAIVNQASSVKWAFSTSGPPSVATILAGSNFATPSADGVVTVNGSSPLNLGDKLWVGFVCFAATDYSVQLPVIYATGSYQSFSATKTFTWGPGQFTQSLAQATGIVVGGRYFYGGPLASEYGAVINGTQAAADSVNNLTAALNTLLPGNGAIATGLEVGMYQNTGALNLLVSFVRSDNSVYANLLGFGGTVIGQVTGSNTGSWLPYTASFSETVSGTYPYAVYISAGTGVGAPPAAGAWNNIGVSYVALTFSMPTPKAAL